MRAVIVPPAGIAMRMLGGMTMTMAMAMAVAVCRGLRMSVVVMMCRHAFPLAAG